MGRVLVVDDESSTCRGFKRILEPCGYAVETAGSVAQAEVLLEQASFDVVVSDLVMQGEDGIAFLRTLRRIDSGVPLILATGNPSLETAIAAVEHGAFHYLTKPVDAEVLVATVDRAARAFARSSRQRQIADQVGLEAAQLFTLQECFSSALETIRMAFQPIVSLGAGRAAGYEALLRTEEKSLARPDDFLHAAERLGRLNDLGRRVRGKVADAMVLAPRDCRVFVNLHAQDLDDQDLYSPTGVLSAWAPRITLEITERAAIGAMANLDDRILALRTLGYQVAVDDLGAGYAGLSSLARIQPDVVKIDMSLVRSIDRDPARRHIVQAILHICTHLKMQAVAEGVETVEERDALSQLGCDLLQGYLFARPAFAFEMAGPAGKQQHFGGDARSAGTVSRGCAGV